MKIKFTTIFSLALILTAFNVESQTKVVVTNSNANQSITLQQEQLLEIKLPSDMPSSGYGWYVKNIDNKTLTQFGDWKYIKTTKGVGGEGIQVIQFAGVSKGQTD
ncbi:MAG: protease inhibitor I42 family protein, partial [Bacteroidales bacterium]|nr:protease inhibitor I42 family protein [Bacteroidales bacterium]